MNSLMIRPRMTLQFNDGNEMTDGLTVFNSELLSQTNSFFASDLSGLDFSNNLLWRHKMKKRGRTFSVNVASGYAPQKGDLELQSLNAFFTPSENIDTLDQQGALDINKWNVKTSFNYTEPLNEQNQLMFEYEVSYQQEDSEREVFDFMESTQDLSLIHISEPTRPY